MDPGVEIHSDFLCLLVMYFGLNQVPLSLDNH
ncbi:hypothetical protein DFP78_107211 [Photobacterium lutimaris]|nr:hypothetical protein DFP78_107211 [Photobacterium lutimaris]